MVDKLISGWQLFLRYGPRLRVYWPRPASSPLLDNSRVTHVPMCASSQVSIKPCPFKKNILKWPINICICSNLALGWKKVIHHHWLEKATTSNARKANFCKTFHRKLWLQFHPQLCRVRDPIGYHSLNHWHRPTSKGLSLLLWTLRCVSLFIAKPQWFCLTFLKPKYTQKWKSTQPQMWQGCGVTAAFLCSWWDWNFGYTPQKAAWQCTWVCAWSMTQHSIHTWTLNRNVHLKRSTWILIAILSVTAQTWKYSRCL